MTSEEIEKLKDIKPTEMFLCEISRVILHPNQLYIFQRHPTCELCKQYEGNEKAIQNKILTNKEIEKLKEIKGFLESLPGTVNAHMLVNFPILWIEATEKLDNILKNHNAE